MGWLQKIPDELRADLETAMTAEMVHDRLAAITRPPGTDYRLSMTKGYIYEGRFSDMGFTLRRIVGMRAILPRLEGAYTATPAGTRIVIRTKLRAVITATVGVAVGLLLPVVAIFLTIIVIGNMKLVMSAITAAIVAATFAYIVSIKNRLIIEFDKDRKILGKLLCPSDASVTSTPTYTSGDQ